MKHTVDFVYIHQRKVKSINVSQSKKKKTMLIILDPSLNRDNSIPTDNGEHEQIDRSPDSPNQPSSSSSPPPQQQIHEAEYQRQTIIPTVHLDSLLNHNHKEEDDGWLFSSSSNFFHSQLFFFFFRSKRFFTNR